MAIVAIMAKLLSIIAIITIKANAGNNGQISDNGKLLANNGKHSNINDKQQWQTSWQ